MDEHDFDRRYGRHERFALVIVRECGREVGGVAVKIVSVLRLKRSRERLDRPLELESGETRERHVRNPSLILVRDSAKIWNALGKRGERHLRL